MWRDQGDLVWRIVQRDLPALIDMLRPLIPPEDEFMS